MKRIIKNTLRRFGFDLIRRNAKSPRGLTGGSGLNEQEQEILAMATPYSMTSRVRMISLMDSVKHIVKNKIEGDIVECGVWRGGSMMIVASMLKALGDESRSLYLYDTYQGMPDPTDVDIDHMGTAASKMMASTTKGQGIWCEASLDDVRKNVLSTGYPTDKIHFIQGKVEETIPRNLPSRLALLRLDTDWYESTKHELTHLYPLLCSNGILIIDDYGHWQGVRKAVDEYFEGSAVFLHRIDHPGRLVVKSVNEKRLN